MASRGPTRTRAIRSSTSTASYVGLLCTERHLALLADAALATEQFAQYTTEWAIPAERAPACLREMSRWLAEEAADPEGIRVHFPIEIRWTSDDDIWLSPSFGRQTVYIGIVQYR